MQETRVAKLFKNGASQAVRLPAEFRLPGDEVYVTRDEVTGDLLLSAHPGLGVWDDFFALIHSVNVPTNFMAERPMNVLPKERNLFDESE